METAAYLLDAAANKLSAQLEWIGIAVQPGVDIPQIRPLGSRFFGFEKRRLINVSGACILGSILLHGSVERAKPIPKGSI